MKCVVVFVLAAACASGSETVSCNNVSSCTPDVSQMQGGTQEDIKRACRSVKQAMNCFRQAMQDCRVRKNIPEQTIVTLEQQIDEYEDMLAGFCDDDDGFNPSSGADVTKRTFVIVVSFLLALFVS